MLPAGQVRVCLYGRQVIDVSPCSSHLMPCDLHVLNPLQSTWLADQLAANTNMKQAVTLCLQTLETNVFRAKIKC